MLAACIVKFIIKCVTTDHCIDTFLYTGYYDNFSEFSVGTV